MQDLGYSCAATAKCLGEVFAQYGELTHESVAGIVAMLARTTTTLDDSLSLHGALSSAPTLTLTPTLALALTVTLPLTLSQTW